MTTQENINVLLIEDNEPDMESVKRALLRHMKQICYIRHAQTMKEAAEILQDKDYLPDLILLDLGLPDTIGRMDTFERLSKIKKSSIPTLILTSLNDHELAMSMIGGGADDYIQKSRISNDPHSLCEKVEFALGRRKNIANTQKLSKESIAEKDMIISYMSGNYSAM
ncbi:MAG: response regulator [Alphaproteobacteria bacterium]|nr:response regulator [Alphaproteobacteria bacterium]